MARRAPTRPTRSGGTPRQNPSVAHALCMWKVLAASVEVGCQCHMDGSGQPWVSVAVMVGQNGGMLGWLPAHACLPTRAKASHQASHQASVRAPLAPTAGQQTHRAKGAWRHRRHGAAPAACSVPAAAALGNAAAVPQHSPRRRAPAHAAAPHATRPAPAPAVACRLPPAACRRLRCPTPP